MLVQPPCSVYDQSVPGTGPPKLAVAQAPSVDFEKYNSSFNLSLRSKSDYNLNPIPEGNVKTAFPRFQRTREGVYAIETDRGELNQTNILQTNLKGNRTFQNRLQDTVRPTTKETTIYTYDGAVAPVHKAQSDYSQFIPYYAPINGKQVRINGSSNFGLRSATEYSYFATPGPTGLNTSVVQNPDAAIGQNTQPVADFNVDGPGTLRNALPDAGKFQDYVLIAKPTTNALKLNYNLETDGGSLHDYSQLLGKQVDGIENRYTASYQIAPLLTNPLNVIWNPDNKGELPTFLTNQNAQDYSYIQQKALPQNEYFQGGYNNVWEPNQTTNSANSYVLGMSDGIYNQQINWQQGRNERPGITYPNSNKVLPGASWGGNRSLDDLFMGDQQAINKAYPFVNMTYATLGSPGGQFA